MAQGSPSVALARLALEYENRLREIEIIMRMLENRTPRGIDPVARMSQAEWDRIRELADL